MIVASKKRPGGYFINGKFVFAVNWELSKERFTKDEQQQFEKILTTIKL